MGIAARVKIGNLSMTPRRNADAVITITDALVPTAKYRFTNGYPSLVWLGLELMVREEQRILFKSVEKTVLGSILPQTEVLIFGNSIAKLLVCFLCLLPRFSCYPLLRATAVGALLNQRIRSRYHDEV